MKILAVSDVESPLLYDYYKPGRLAGYDLIIACGDLSAEYLEFLVTMAGCPLVYVHGNHDDYTREPGGCVCIDNRVFEYRGLRIAGLPGSHRYREGTYMYTERQMESMVKKLKHPIRRMRGVDILVTHAPARHLNDFDSVSHRGFECFHTLLDHFRPALYLHGHIHMNYGAAIPRRTVHGGTTVINACDHCVIELDDPATVAEGSTKLRRRALRPRLPRPFANRHKASLT